MNTKKRLLALILAVLMVLPAGLTASAAEELKITTQPSSVTYAEGASPTELSVAATGDGLTYQWYKRVPTGLQAVGTDSATFTPPPSASTVGPEFYRVVVTDSTGASVTSSEVSVGLAQPTFGGYSGYEVLLNGTYKATALVDDDDDPATPDVEQVADTAAPLTLTVTGILTKWYEYSTYRSNVLYFKPGGTFKFSQPVKLTNPGGSGAAKYIAADTEITASAEYNEYFVALNNGDNIGIVWAPDGENGTNNYASLKPNREMDVFPGQVIGIAEGGSQDVVIESLSVGYVKTDNPFVESNTVTIKQGSSLNLTALLRFSGNLLFSNDVTWTVDSSSGVESKVIRRSASVADLYSNILAGDEQLNVTGTTVGGTLTATVKSVKDPSQSVQVTVTVEAPLVANPNKTSLVVTDDGVKNWDYPAPTGDTYLGFTADVHFNANTATGVNVYESWMARLKTQLNGETLDYMNMLGDNLSAYSSGDAGWANVQALMNIGAKFKTGGANAFVDNELFLLGNHERWASAGANFEAKIAAGPTAPYYSTAAALSVVGQSYDKTDAALNDNVAATGAGGYILYDFGASKSPWDSPYYGGALNSTNQGGYGAQDLRGTADENDKDEIDKLEAFLNGKPTNIPIFVMAHYPIHTYRSPENAGDRESGGAVKLINVLNQHPNVIYLWGHNHSSSDPMYGRLVQPGDFLDIGQISNGETMQINFYYSDAGCMSDIEYRSSVGDTSVPGSANVKGKGTLAAITGNTVTLVKYVKPDNERVAENFKLPAELNDLKTAADSVRVWYGAADYRANEELGGVVEWSEEESIGKPLGTEWKDANMLAWAQDGTVLGGGTNVLIVGFKADTSLKDLAAELTTIAGYELSVATGSGSSAKTAQANMELGKFGVSVSKDEKTVFVLLYSNSDGTIWLGKTIGDAQVWELKGNTISLWDKVSTTLGTWTPTSTVTEAQIEGAILVAGTAAAATTVSIAADFDGTDAALTVGDKTYTVKKDVPPKLEIPLEIAAQINAGVQKYGTWYGHKDYVANTGSFGSGTMQNLTTLQDFGMNLLIVAIHPNGSSNAAGYNAWAETNLSNIAAYGGASIGTISASNLPTPGHWGTVVSSNGYAFIVLYADYYPGDDGDPRTWAPDADGNFVQIGTPSDCTVARNIDMSSPTYTADKIIRGATHTPSHDDPFTCEVCGGAVVPESAGTMQFRYKADGTAPSETDTTVGGGATKAVTLTVDSGVTSVNVSADLTGEQRLTAVGADAAKVTANAAGFTVDTSAGGALTFGINLIDGAKATRYTFTVNVGGEAPPPTALPAALEGKVPQELADTLAALNGTDPKWAYWESVANWSTVSGSPVVSGGTWSATVSGTVTTPFVSGDLKDYAADISMLRLNATVDAVKTLNIPSYGGLPAIGTASSDIGTACTALLAKIKAGQNGWLAYVSSGGYTCILLYKAPPPPEYVSYAIDYVNEILVVGSKAYSITNLIPKAKTVVITLTQTGKDPTRVEITARPTTGALEYSTDGGLTWSSTKPAAVGDNAKQRVKAVQGVSFAGATVAYAP